MKAKDQFVRMSAKWMAEHWDELHHAGTLPEWEHVECPACYYREVGYESTTFYYCPEFNPYTDFERNGE